MSKSPTAKGLQHQPTSSSTTSKKHSVFVGDKLSSQDFALSKIIHHGFPYRPTCMSYDQRSGLIAIGTELGYIRILGREYVDRCFRDDVPSSIVFISLKTIADHDKEFLRMITINYPSRISLWTVCNHQLTLISSRTFSKEKFSCAQLSASGKVLFFGCDSGNVYILNTSSLSLSNQIIHWNRAVGPSMKSHPGSIVLLRNFSIDRQKLFIGYSPYSSDEQNELSNGAFAILVKWNLKSSKFEEVATMNSGLTCVSLHADGKILLCGHLDGSYSAWNFKCLDKPLKVERPHGLISTSVVTDYHPLTHIHQIPFKNGDVYTCFTGGVHLDGNLKSKYLTLIRKRSTNVLQMDSAIVDLQMIYDSNSEPLSIALLLVEDLVFIDLKNDESLFHKSPHFNTLNSYSPISFFDYIASPDQKLYYNLLKIHNCFPENVNKSANERTSTNHSEWTFPLSGGVPGETIFSYNELIITGHMNGKVCFWDASAMNFSPIYTTSTERFIYSKTEEISTIDQSLQSPCNSSDSHCFVSNDTLFGMLSVKSAVLSTYKGDDCLIIVGNYGHISLLKFNTDQTDSNEELTDITVLEMPSRVITTPEQSPDKSKTVSKPPFRSMLNVRVACRRLMGFHPDIVCLIPMSTNSDIISNKVNASLSIDHTWLVILIHQQIVFIDTAVKTISALIDVDEFRASVDPIVFTNQQNSPSRDKQPEFYPNEQLPEVVAVADLTDKVSNSDDDNLPNQTFKNQTPQKHIEPQLSSSYANEFALPNTGQTHASIIKKTKSSFPTNQLQSLHSASSLTSERTLSTSSVQHPRRSMASTMKQGFHRFSINSIKNKTRQKSVDPSDDGNADLLQEEGVIVTFSNYSQSESENLNQLMWIATSTGRVFAAYLFLDDCDHKSMRLIRYWDPIKIFGTIILIKFFTVNITGESYESYPLKKISAQHIFYIALASSTNLKVCCVPNNCCVFERTLSSEIQASWMSNLNDAVYLCTINKDAPVFNVYSLPKLDILFQCCFNLTDEEFSGDIGQRLICSNFGMICCLLNPFEICKWSISESIGNSIPLMHGQLFQVTDNKRSMRKGLNVSSQVNRYRQDVSNSDSSGFFFFKIFSSNDSFNEHSLFDKNEDNEPHGIFTKPYSSSIASNSSITRTHSGVNSTNSEVSQLLRAGEERGMRLNQLDHATAKMAEDAREFQLRAKQLSDLHKQRSEKWWQLWR